MREQWTILAVGSKEITFAVVPLSYQKIIRELYYYQAFIKSRVMVPRAFFSFQEDRGPRVPRDCIPRRHAIHYAN